jgi:hypothetical protein
MMDDGGSHEAILVGLWLSTRRRVSRKFCRDSQTVTSVEDSASCREMYGQQVTVRSMILTMVQAPQSQPQQNDR